MHITQPSPSLWRTAIALGALALASIAAAPTFAQNVVAPGAQEFTDGNSQNRLPFDTAGASLASERYQQVYRASEFGAITAPSLITAIAFRPDGSGFGAAFGPTDMTVDIRLSTTTAAPDALAGTFASNTGANEAVVYAGNLTLSSAFTGPVGGAKDFDIVINLQTPFLYNPAAGNLLLDVRLFSRVSVPLFDSQVTDGDGISRVFALDSGSGNPVNSATGFADTSGLVTRFTFVSAASAPEPSTLALFVLGAGVPILMARRRVSKKS